MVERLTNLINIFNFKWGEPPAKQGDYAYLLHIIRSMKSTGKAACILPHGVLFRGIKVTEAGAALDKLAYEKYPL